MVVKKGLKAKKTVTKKTIKSKNSKKKSIDERLTQLEKNQIRMLELQELILKKEELIEKEEGDVLDLEARELTAERVVQVSEEKELEELAKIGELERQIEENTQVHPLKRITYRDITKGIIGSFFGIVGHFAFSKGIDISEHFSYTQSILLYVTSFVIIIAFLYFSGFRKVTDEFVLKIMPLRAIVLYTVSLLSIILVLFLYGKVTFATPFSIIFNAVAAISILAVIGAGTADLIGKNE